MIKFIKKIINKIKKKIILFKKLQVGDLVWAKMPLSNKELNKIPKSHQIRPYLIAYKDFWNIYAYQASSKKSKKLNNYEVYGISKLRYKKSKDTWIELNKINKISFNNLKSKFNSLNIMDLKAIEKRLQILKNRRKEVKYMFDKEISLSEGDVVSLNNSMFFIYATDNVNIYTYNLFKKVQNKSLTEVIINRKKYYIDIKEKKTFRRELEFKIIDIASFNEIECIKKIKKSLSVKVQKEESQKLISQKDYEFGTVFQAGKDKIVYLFELEGIYYGVDSIMYQMFPRILKIHNIDEKTIVDIYDRQKLKEILEILVLNNVSPHKIIRNLYDEIRNNV